jgi:DNA-binding beta-propeller fold protein YncE
MLVYPPTPAAGGPEQLLYIADTHYFRVMVYRPPADLEHPGELVTQWGSFGQGPGQFTYLTDVAVLPGADGSVEKIYVSEYGGNDRINIFDKDHHFLTAFGQLGSSAEPDKIEFNRPQSIQIDKDRRELIVTDACNHRIGVFMLDGKLIRWIGAPEHAGAGPDEFNLPYGLAVLPDYTALVTEFGNHRVHHVDLESGQTLGLYGKPGRGPGELTNPWAITVLKDTVYVLDSGNARVQAFKAPRPIRHPALSAASGTPEGHG